MEKIMMVFDMPGVTKENYDKVWEELKAQGHSKPDGLLVHAGAPTENGWMVVDIWESQEKVDKFSQVLMPIIQGTGMKVEGGPKMMKIDYLQTNLS